MFSPDEAVAVALHPALGAAVVGDRGDAATWTTTVGFDAVERIERETGPRWVWWDTDTARALVRAGIRPARCWDLGAVHRLLHGGWRAGPALVWAATRGLDTHDLPTVVPVDLFSAAGADDADGAPVRADGHLHPDWVEGAWHQDGEHLARWAELALEAYHGQQRQLRALDERPAAPATARSESAAALLAAELEHDGLPIDVVEAERIIATFIGPRPHDAADEQRLVEQRDQRVLRHLGATGAAGAGVDLRNPASVKSLLRRAGIEVPDTRAWRLEERRDEHPIVGALLEWRSAERIATTFGYRWLDEHVDAGRLRGSWAASDGAAGRMTATAGLHNLPADLRSAVAAETGHVFVRADLGQIEPRILAAISGDDGLAVATHQHDMYATVALELGVEREVAKVAVLGAMYGQTTGHGAAARHRLDAAYPVAMRFLTDAAELAEGGHDLRTRGGRLVSMSPGTIPDDPNLARSRAAGRGRYGRNAMVQGAAAEFFKTWAAVVRARSDDGTIVLCLHDELLVHTPSGAAEATRAIVLDALREAAHRWSAAAASDQVRFIADTTIIHRWSDAKDAH